MEAGLVGNEGYDNMIRTEGGILRQESEKAQATGLQHVEMQSETHYLAQKIIRHRAPIAAANCNIGAKANTFDFLEGRFGLLPQPARRVAEWNEPYSPLVRITFTGCELLAEYNNKHVMIRLVRHVGNLRLFGRQP